MKNLIDLYKKESNNAFLSIPTEDIETFVNMIIKAYTNEQKVFACGNGGNVASVQNLVLDLNMHPFVSEDKSARKGGRNKFQAISLCDSGATITGIGNVIEALKVAKEKGMICVVMTRNLITKSDEYADLMLRITSENSTFPGQTGGNNNNFHYEDCISSVSHIAVGILKQYVENEN
jgi:D-sedoheptulose 7-phosphate isomerase